MILNLILLQDYKLISFPRPGISNRGVEFHDFKKTFLNLGGKLFISGLHDVNDPYPLNNQIMFNRNVAL